RVRASARLMDSKGAQHIESPSSCLGPYGMQGERTMTTRLQRRSLAVAALTALTIAAAAVTPVDAAGSGSADAPIVTIHDGAVRGEAVTGGYAFRGLPYAAPPTGDLRWRPPQRAPRWSGVRDATEFSPNCPQPERPPMIDVMDEDCLYLNVYTPGLG